jgi:dihydropteroate synthase
MNPPTSHRTLACRARTLELGAEPLIVGVLNVTPDSFSDGGRYENREQAVRWAHEMSLEGAAVIDVGGESTRPGSDAVSSQEEMDRVLPVIESLVMGDDYNDPLPAPVSIDTKKPDVARAALELGAHIVNDVSGVREPGMVELLAEWTDVPVIVMHMKGSPKDMQDGPWYDDVVEEVTGYLRDRAEALEAAGVAAPRIVIDPGIGFGKRLEDNLELLKNIDALKRVGYPVLIGASRKSFLGQSLGRDPGERLAGSLAAAAHCWLEGADLIRVHDVTETADLYRTLALLRDPNR